MGHINKYKTAFKKQMVTHKHWCEQVLLLPFIYTDLKEYYEILDESRPLSAIFPTHADICIEMHF